MKGYHALVLHAHLPFVRHPEHDRFLEEDWLYEAITETYLPLLEKFDALVEDGVRFRLTLTMTPPLVAMLRDGLLMGRYTRHLDALCELAAREVERTRHDSTFNPLALFYKERFERLRGLFHGRYKGDVVGAFKRLQDEGVLEIVTCGATHGFLPLLKEQPEAVRAQLLVAKAHHQAHFGVEPQGIWLGECGYYPGLDALLAEAGLRYFFVDTHAALDAAPRPRFGAYAPLYTPSGVAAFARDQESGAQVWSADKGYPGDPLYREFYRDLGYDLDLELIRPWIQPTGDRKNVGIKYFRITGGVELNAKEPYNPWAARDRAAIHAGNFLFNRERQIENLASALGRPPLVVSPYDAELFGHWWFEGPEFIDAYIRKATFDQDTYTLCTPLDYLAELPEQQVSTPPYSSWGAGGYAGVWLDPSNDWIYRHLHKAAERMVALVRDLPHAEGIERRALDQCARELLLAQSSDWAFIMKTGTMVEYAVRRTKEHIASFTSLHDGLRAGHIDEGLLSTLEGRHNIFPDIDHRVFARVEESAEGPRASGG